VKQQHEHWLVGAKEHKGAEKKLLSTGYTWLDKEQETVAT